MSSTTIQNPHADLNVLALGAGVQSTTILLMCCLGEYPHPNAVVFADAGWELPAVYRNLDFLNHAAQKANIPLYNIVTGDIRTEALQSHLFGPPVDPQKWASMPCFTKGQNGNKGMLRRQCTLHYKIRPIDAFIRQKLLSLPKHAKCPAGTVNLWFGISTDEMRRVHPAEHKWKTNCYPLVELDMSRKDCHRWLDNHGYHHPARSSCVGCPYRSNSEWRWIRDHQPDAWQDAIDFDAAIRNPAKIAAQLFLHQQRIPLDQADLSPAAEQEITPPWQNECWGYCNT